MNTTIHTITENTTLGELISILGDVTKAGKTPTSKTLREEAGDPIATEERCMVYANGYAVYDNGSGRTVVWVPSCASYKYQFDPMKESEKGHGIVESLALEEGLLESLPWAIAITLNGDHRVEKNNMNHRRGGRKGTKDYDADDYGDKDGDAEDAVEQSYQKEYSWREDRIGEDPEAIYIRREMRRKALKSMTDRQREIFILVYEYGYKQREIAEMLGITQVGVKHHLDTSIKKLKKVYEIGY